MPVFVSAAFSSVQFECLLNVWPELRCQQKLELDSQWYSWYISHLLDLHFFLRLKRMYSLNQIAILAYVVYSVEFLYSLHYTQGSIKLNS